jgi:tRNA acetyltransferase TAN1
MMHACGTATPILTAADTRQNVVGMSVVGPDFEKLKRFNLEELRQPLSIDNTNSSSRLKISEDE